MTGHKPIPMSDNSGPLTRSLGHWVECECSWISESYRTEENALKCHARHVVAYDHEVAEQMRRAGFTADASEFLRQHETACKACQS